MDHHESCSPSGAIVIFSLIAVAFAILGVMEHDKVPLLSSVCGVIALGMLHPIFGCIREYRHEKALQEAHR